MSTTVIHVLAPWWLADYLKSPMPSDLVWPSKEALVSAIEAGIEEIADDGCKADFWSTLLGLEGTMETFLMKLLESIFRNDNRCILMDMHTGRYQRLLKFVETYGETGDFARSIADYTLKAKAEIWDDWMSCPSELFNETILIPLVWEAKKKVEVLFELFISQMAKSPLA